LGRERTLLIVACKKWHVAKRLVERDPAQTGICRRCDYLFNEEATTPLPDLGGIQTTLEKRTRHRRALVRMLFDYWDRPAGDLRRSGQHRPDAGFLCRPVAVRLLEIECDFSPTTT
jgi:hypothetical protein